MPETPVSLGNPWPSPVYDNLRLDTKAFWPEKITNVLEVGCSTGKLATVLPCQTYWGIEPDLVSATIASGHQNSRIINSDFAGALADLPRHFFDCVICHDVLEHMPDHDFFLKHLPSLCTDNASLIMTVPNMRHILLLRALLVSRTWEYQDSGLMDRTHLRWFTEKTLRATLARHGYCLSSFERRQRNYFTQNPLKIMAAEIITAIIGTDSRYVYFAVKASVPNFRQYT